MTLGASGNTGPSEASTASISKNMMLKTMRMDSYLSTLNYGTALNYGTSAFGTSISTTNSQANPLGACLLNAGQTYVQRMAWALGEVSYGVWGGGGWDYVASGWSDAFTAGYDFVGDIWNCYGLPCDPNGWFGWVCPPI